VPRVRHRLGVRRLPVLLLAAVFLTGWAGAPGSAKLPTRDVSAYEGLGTWVDLFDPSVLRRPEAAVQRMDALGVTTLYLETSNSRQRRDLVRPSILGRLLEAAHARGMTVVAWYLPYLTKPLLDARRTTAAIRFRSQHGERFDSFALDIESSAVHSASLRNARLLALSKTIRRVAGDGVALGAVIPSPLGMQLLPRYWPGFPYRQLAALYDAFLPMSYFTYRAKGERAVHDYTARNVAIIRSATGDPDVPIHMIGGVASRASAVDVRGFMRAVRECDVSGVSLYDFATTRTSQWRQLATFDAGALPTTGLC
jgi:hypothetical protein